MPWIRERLPECGYVFIDDGAPCHTVRNIFGVFAASGVQMLLRSGNWTDFNFLENVKKVKSGVR